MNDREQIHLHESQVLVLRDAFQKKRSIWREIVPTSLIGFRIFDHCEHS